MRVGFEIPKDLGGTDELLVMIWLILVHTRRTSRGGKRHKLEPPCNAAGQLLIGQEHDSVLRDCNILTYLVELHPRIRVCRGCVIFEGTVFWVNESTKMDEWVVKK